MLVKKAVDSSVSGKPRPNVGRCWQTVQYPIDACCVKQIGMSSIASENLMQGMVAAEINKLPEWRNWIGETEVANIKARG
jgi:hypothetical protein